MRPKARGQTQHGGPPGWLEDSDPAGVILYVMDGPYRLLFHAVPVALKGAAKLRADGMYTTIRLELRHTRKSWPGTRCLLFDC